MKTRSITLLETDCQQSFDQIIRQLLKRVTKENLIREKQSGVNYVLGKYQFQKGPLPICESQILWLAIQAKSHFLKGPSLLQLSSPIVVVGDIHGQFEDMVMIFETLRHPPQRSYLFLGDYVDRGENSIETICLLFAYACLYPKNVFLLRGNHELMMMNMRMGFQKECQLRITDESIYNSINETFDSMPFAAIIDRETFCCHGGIGPHLLSEGLSGIQAIKRPLYPLDDCLATDLMWADPSKEQQFDNFVHNKIRNISYFWNPNVAEQFLKNEGLKLLVRGHQVAMRGYEQHLHPLCYTVFSAPRYMNRLLNDAAVMAFLRPGPDYRFVVYIKN